MMGKKILSVDDSPSVRKLVQFTLKSKGYEVTSAENGLEALNLMADMSFDAIILDINMPKMDGLQFLKKIRSENISASIPVVMLTTEGQDEDKNKSLELGASAYIVKPFKPTELLKLMDEVLKSG